MTTSDTDPSRAVHGPDRHPADDDGPPSEAARLDAFISYTRRPDDTAFVDRLRDDLLARGKQVWLDRHRIEPAADWRQRIDRGINAAKALIFVVSPDSLASSECAQELGIGAQQSKLIIPVILKDVDAKDVPEALAKPNWIYYRDGDDGAGALAKIVEALDADLEWRDTHARLGVRAHEWTAANKDASFLLRGKDLRQAETWYGDKASHKQQPTDLHYRYIEASRRAAAKRQRILLSGVGLALVVALVLAVVAFVQRNAAVTNQHVAQSRQLAAEGTASLVSDPALSALFSLKALHVHYTTQAENALREAAPALQLLKTFPAGSRVGSAAFSPTGDEVVTTAENGTAKIWSTTTGHLLRTLVEPATGGLGSQNFSTAGNSITAASFSPNGAEVVTASDDTTARIWDVSSGKQLAVFDETNTLNDAAFSPDGAEVIVASTQGQADIWDVATRKQVKRFNEPGGAIVTTAVFSPDGADVLTASDDGTARVWDVANGTLVNALREPYRAVVTDASYSPDGSEIVTASQDGTARVWDAATGGQVLVLGLRSGDNLATARFSPDGSEVVTAGNGAVATVWDASTGEQLTLLDEPQGGRMSGASFGPTGAYVLTSDNDGTARIWDANPRQLVVAVREPGRWALRDVAFNPAGTEFVTGSDDGTARIWDATTGKQLAVMHEGINGSNFQYGGNSIRSVSFSPDGAEVVTASTDGTARIWDASTGAQLLVLPASFQVYSAEFSRGGTEVMTANDSGQVDIWNAATGKMTNEFTATNAFLLGAAFSPDGTKIIAAVNDGTARVLDARTGRQLMVLKEPGGNPIGSAVFSPDGRRIVTASDDGTARVWDATTGQQLVVVHDLDGARFYDASFSPDGTKIVTASGSGQATVWDAATGKELTSLGYAQGVTIYSASFRTGGQQLVTASYDGRASVWSATLAAPLGQLVQVVTHLVDSGLPTGELAAEQRRAGE